jgi:hypothetical protein
MRTARLDDSKKRRLDNKWPDLKQTVPVRMRWMLAIPKYTGRCRAGSLLKDENAEVRDAGADPAAFPGQRSETDNQSEPFLT